MGGKYLTVLVAIIVLCSILRHHIETWQIQYHCQGLRMRRSLISLFISSISFNLSDYNFYLIHQLKYKSHFLFWYLKSIQHNNACNFIYKKYATSLFITNKTYWGLNWATCICLIRFYLFFRTPSSSSLCCSDDFLNQFTKFWIRCFNLSLNPSS